MAGPISEGFATAWRRHWGLMADPFAADRLTYVPLPSHEEAVARLLYAIESAERRSSLVAESGMGKTKVMEQVIQRAAQPNRRIAAVTCPPDGVLLLTRLTELLGQRRASRSVVNQSDAWRLLDRAVRLLEVVGCHVVLAIDDCHRLENERRGGVLDTLHLLGDGHASQLTVITFGQINPSHSDEHRIDWPPAAALEPMTRNECERYLTTKLASSGCSGHLFTARALTRLHGLSQGVPRTLERLATLSLMAGALRGVEVVTPDLVDGATQMIDPRPTENLIS